MVGSELWRVGVWVPRFEGDRACCRVVLCGWVLGV